MTRVLIVDDHAVVRAGLRYLVDAEEDLETVGQAGSVAEALAQAGSVAPDVILLDVVMPEQTGIAGIPELLAAFSGVRILMLSMEANPGYVRQALAAGASGYVLKSANPSELMEAVETVASGGNYLQAGLGVAVARQHSEERHDADASLSANEAAIVRLIARGFTNAEIASQRGVSLRTIETQRANVLRHLGLRTRADLVRYAYEHGLAERGS